MKRDIESVVRSLTLEEKAGLCSGADHWRTKAVERAGIPSLRMSDGPHGLRKQTVGGDHLGLKKSDPATCFPPAVTAACSWDRELVARLAAALGRECAAEGVDVLLGPGVNLKRSPLCGRNFEYYSEDPFLAGELGKAFVEGLQSEGVGACVKHFAANNQENDRFLADSIVDERTLRELYLAAFEPAVVEARCALVMCAYNKLNGTYCSEHGRLLTDILKKEWGHRGIVVSDWGAVNDRVEGLAAGLELQMPPGHYEHDRVIAAAVREGRLPEPILDASVSRSLELAFRLRGADRRTDFDPADHHRLAREALRECIVLLKNDDAVLPLRPSGSLAVIGAFAAEPRFQGGGSSFVTPYRIDNALAALKERAGGSVAVDYAPGYRMDPPSARYCDEPFSSASDTPDPALIAEAAALASRSDAAVVFVGLPVSYESEGHDRSHLRIPEGHRALLEAVAAARPNAVVVLSNGSPVEMPWIGSVKGVVEAYLGGQASGGAIADILFGDANPCGKLAETFPAALSDTPTFLDVPGTDTREVEYREGLFIGYRHYEAKGIRPLFPFGFGLSYTAFAYEGIEIDKDELSDAESLTVRVRVRNVGERRGKEVVQLYVRDRESSVIRPAKELKGFAKLDLEPGAVGASVFVLGKRAFAHWSVEEGGWRVEDGLFDILCGPSSAQTPLRKTVRVFRADRFRKPYTRNSTLAECLAHPEGRRIVGKLIEAAAARFALREGTARYEQTLAGIPLRCAVSQFGIPFTEAELGETIDRLNG